MNKKSIFFDFDGVLMNSHDLTIEILQVFYPDYTKEEFDKVFHSNVYEDKKVLDVITNHRKKFDDLFLSKTKKEHFFPFAKKFLDDLYENYNLFIISGAPTHCLINHLNLIECTDKFEKILGADVSHSKVERFNMLIEEYSLDKENIIFITDSLGDVNEANEVGLLSLGVTWGVHDSDTLSKGNPYKIFSEFLDLEKFIFEEF